MIEKYDDSEEFEIRDGDIWFGLTWCIVVSLILFGCCTGLLVKIFVG